MSAAREIIENACDQECKRRDRALSELAMLPHVDGAAAALRYSVSWLIADKLAAALDGGAEGDRSEVDVIDHEVSRIDDRLATAEAELAKATEGSEAAGTLAVEVAIFGEVSDRLHLVIEEATDAEPTPRGTGVSHADDAALTDHMGRG